MNGAKKDLTVTVDPLDCRGRSTSRTSVVSQTSFGGIGGRNKSETGWKGIIGGGKKTAEGCCSIMLNSSTTEPHRERSASACDGLRRLGNYHRTSIAHINNNNNVVECGSNFLSPTRNVVSGHRKSSLGLLDPRGRRRSASPLLDGGGATASPFFVLGGGAIGAGVKRSTSSSTVRSYGSNQHLGSSVTFCSQPPLYTTTAAAVRIADIGRVNTRSQSPGARSTVDSPSHAREKEAAAAEDQLRRSSSAMWTNSTFANDPFSPAAFAQRRRPSSCPRRSLTGFGSTVPCNSRSGSLVAGNSYQLTPAQVRMINFIGGGRSALSPPEISVDGDVPPGEDETGDAALRALADGTSALINSRSFGSAYHLQGGQPKSVMVTSRRGSFLAVNQSPLEFRESTLSINYPNCEDDGEEVSLVYARLEKIPMKDFAAEIRAHLDVEQFLSQAQLMLDLQETNMEDILDTMLHHLLDKDESAAAYVEATKVLFTHDSVHQLSKTIQCTCSTYGGGYDYDQSWVCVLCTAASVQKRHVAIARLRNPANLGRTSQEVWFIILVITSTKEKGTKNALETGRTFATLFADMDLRLELLGARTELEFKQLMWEHMKELADEQCEGNASRKISLDSQNKRENGHVPTGAKKCRFAEGLRADWRRRIPHYLSDFTDGFCGPNTLHKTVSTTFFLYFACILPAIALGVLNYNNTGGLKVDPDGQREKGKIDVRRVIYSQMIGGLFFAIFGGQPMVILLTTAPLALYTKVIYTICDDWHWEFIPMYACTGLWNSFFLLIYAVTDASKLMKWCTRSTEEIFALFISMAFAFDAFKDVIYDFQDNYHSPKCYATTNMTETASSTMQTWAGLVTTNDTSIVGECRRESSLLYLLLVLGTVWLGLSLYNFTKTPFLNASKRELLADCALPVSVLIMSFFGSYVFRDVKLKKFDVLEGDIFVLAPLQKLAWQHVLSAMALGFCLSLLFFMDQNIAGAMVNSPDNRMKKGPAYHWDLMIIAILNAFLALFGLPMVHGALPHTPLHVRAMADVEDRVFQGHVYLKIVSVRETRVTGICAHVLIGLSLLLIEQLKSIPRPVLDGLFLYLAITALHSNQLFERIMLLVTEQAAYPPNHYIRTVPQRKIHLYTFLQLLQLAVLCGFGFAPISYLKMVFPILHLVMLPVRHKLVPNLIEKKYLHSLDGH